MKAVEIGYTARLKELEKLNKRLERAQKSLSKKKAVAEKIGVAAWTEEDHRAFLNSIETNEYGWIVNKADIKKNGAYYDLIGAEREVEEVSEEIRNAEARLDKAEELLERHKKEVEAIEGYKNAEALRAQEFEAERKEWKKDGIALERRYAGYTPSGKRFEIYGNSGYTRRSLHCFTLYIDGNTVFTSGEFWRAYAVIKNS